MNLKSYDIMIYCNINDFVKKFKSNLISLIDIKLSLKALKLIYLLEFLKKLFLKNSLLKNNEFFLNKESNK